MSSGQSLPVNPTTLFDLYDFFSMFIPGTTLIIGLYPFLPPHISINFYSIVLVTLLIGYVVGRGVHSAAESADNILNNPSHRDVLGTLLRETHESDAINEMADSFYKRVTSDMPLNEYPDEREDASNSLIAIIYVQARSKLEMEGRGRAPTFQATFAFYRSIHFVMVALALIYIGYALANLYNLIPPVIDYTTFIGSLHIPFGWLAAGGEVLAGLSLITFHDAKTDHRNYYLHYLVQEYLILSGEHDK